MSLDTSRKPLSSSRYYLINGLLNWLVDNDLTPYILVDATYPGSKVPPQFIKNGQIVLNISSSATSHFQLLHSHLSFRATFSGQLQTIQVPIRAIEAIYAKENGEGMSFGIGIPGESEDSEESGTEESQIELNVITDAIDSSDVGAASKPHTETSASKPKPILKIVK